MKNKNIQAYTICIHKNMIFIKILQKMLELDLILITNYKLLLITNY